MAMQGGGVTFAGGDIGSGTDIQLNDNVKLILGTSGDFEFFTDGTDLFLDLGADSGYDGFMIGLGASFPSPDGVAVHIWKATAGAVDAAANSMLVLESDSDTNIQILGGASSLCALFFGDATAAAGGLLYDHLGTRMIFRVENDSRIFLSTGEIQFQQEEIISSTAGNIVFTPTVYSEFTTQEVHTSTATITAFSGGGQASAVLLTATYSEVTVVAATGDSVKLPAAVAGLVITVRNNDSAEAMDVFPNTDDTLNGGSANAAESLAAGVSITYVATDAVDWVSY